MQGQGVDFAVFVGDLAPDVTDYVLQENFRKYFNSVRSAKVGSLAFKVLDVHDCFMGGKALY